MFSEILPRLAVASAYDPLPPTWLKLDVRGLIDGPGNSNQLIADYVSQGLELLSQPETKLVVVCDYGQSRSNFIAAHIFARLQNVSISDGILAVQLKHPDSKIQPSLLDSKSRTREQAIRRVAITGGHGFLGSRLCQNLCEGGFEVFPISRRQHEDYLASSTQFKQCLEHFSPDLIVHLAHPKPYNVETSSQMAFSQLVSVVNYCEDSKVRLLFPSSWVVFDGSTLMEATCDSPTQPHSRYGRLKVASEAFLKAAFARELDGRIIRLPGLFGFDCLDPRFLRYFAQCILQNTEIVFHQFLNGSAVVPLAPVDGCVEAIVRSVVGFDSLAPITHIGTESMTPSVSDIAYRLGNQTGTKVRGSPVPRQTFAGRFVADTMIPLTSISDQIQEFVLQLCRQANVHSN